MKWLIILLFISLMVGEVHGVVYYFYPETANIEYELWLDKKYNEKITVLFYIYELCHILERLIWAYVLCKVGAYYMSGILFSSGVVFFCYYVTQFALYVWNRNTSYFANYLIYLCMACIIIILLIPEKKQGIYKDMNN